MEIKTEKYGLESHNRRFSSEKKCREYLVQQRWDGRPTCSKCNNKHLNYFLTTRNVWKCSQCKHQFSITQGTIFESSKLPLRTWFKAVFFFSTIKRGLSSCQLARLLEVEQRTAWFILHRIREAVSGQNNFVLKGIVEADEAHIGPVISLDTRLQRLKKRHDERQEAIHGLSNLKKRTQRGHPAKRGRKKGSTKEVLAQKKIEKEKLGERIPFEQDIAILGMAQRSGNIVLKLLGRSEKSKTKESIYPQLKKHVNSSAILFTDQWNLYDDTINLFKDHQTVNHNREFVRGNVHTNNIENVWKHLKKMIDGTYFHLSFQHIQKYLHEHSFRWNLRTNSDEEKVNSFFDGIVGKRLKYADLISLPKNPYKIPAA